MSNNRENPGRITGNGVAKDIKEILKNTDQFVIKKTDDSEEAIVDDFAESLGNIKFHLIARCKQW